MNSAKLADVATIHSGGRLGLSGNDFVADGTVPAYGAAGLNGYLDTAEYDDAAAVILSSIGARCGKCFLAVGSWTSLANTQVILPDPTAADPKFLWYQLNDERRWHRSGSAQPFIKPSDVKAHEVYLPPLVEQRRIAAILDHAVAIDAKRLQVLSKVDGLVTALFNATFDLDAYRRESLGALIQEQQIGLVRGAKEQNSEYSHEYLKMDAITRDGQLDLTNLTRVNADDRDVVRYSLADGDLLFNTRNTRELVGKSTVYRGAPRLYNNNLMRIRFRGEVLPDYVHRYLWSPEGRQQLDARKAGTTSVFAIYARTLMTLEVPVPPLRIQEQFAHRIAAIRAQRARIIRACSTNSDLFATLRTRAFVGRL